MEGSLTGGEVRIAGDARQRFHDARGYGRPIQGNEIALSLVEAAHLLSRGDLTAVDGMGFQEFLSRSGGDGFEARFLVYADLRERGFYLSPARAGWTNVLAEDSALADVGTHAPTEDSALVGDTDFVVYPRGKGPRDGDVLYAVRVIGEREPIDAAGLDGVLAVVDEESDVTYFRAERPDLDGVSVPTHHGTVSGELLSDRVVCFDPPDALYETGFYGRPIGGDGSTPALHLSLIEGAYLADEGVLDVEARETTPGSDRSAIVSRGRSVEGERFDRRLAVYAALRERGLVPKTGFKFGADFRVYEAIESVDTLGHSAYLVRVVRSDHTFVPRDLALDVRLAGGVRKRMVFALIGANEETKITWLSVSRLTP